MFKLLLLVLSAPLMATEFDDFETNQGYLFDVPDNGSGVSSFSYIGQASGYGIYRILYVDGGENGSPSTRSSAEVSGGNLLITIEHDATVENQLIEVNWSDIDLSSIWFGSADFSAFERMEIDVAMVTSPVILSMSLRDKNNFIIQTNQLVVNDFGMHQFNFNDFDKIDFTRIDKLSWVITRPLGSQSDVNLIIQEVRLMKPDLVFGHGFEM